MKRSKKRIHGNDRGLMMICRDIRRRWLQYGENRKNPICVCKHADGIILLDIDHITPLGARPRKWEELGRYAKKMFERKCQALCKTCHKEKTVYERQKRKAKDTNI